MSKKPKTQASQQQNQVKALVASFSKGVKSDLLTMIAISRGIVAGMLADKYLGRHQDHYEASLRPHVLSVAQERGFGTFLEVRMPRTGGDRVGAFKKLDYVLSYGRQSIAIECKTIRSKGHILARQGVNTDLAKLKRFPSLVPLEMRASGWFVVAECARIRGRTTPIVIEKRFIKQVLGQIGVTEEALKTDKELIARGSRTAAQNLAFLSCGEVGSHYVCCLAFCVVSS